MPSTVNQLTPIGVFLSIVNPRACFRAFMFQHSLLICWWEKLRKAARKSLFSYIKSQPKIAALKQLFIQNFV